MIHRTIRLLPLFLLLFAFGPSAVAQKKAAKAPAPAPEAETAKADDPEKFRQEFIKAAEDYRASLKELADSYEKSLQKLAEQHEKLKELAADGLIARRDLEASEQSVAEARQKVEVVRQEIATAEATLEAARKPPAPAPAAPVVVASAVEPAWTTGNKQIDNLIRYYGGKYGVDPYLIYCIMHQESRFGAGATSYKGAMGLMQLMPGTAARYGVTNPYDPAQSIMGGTRYLRDLLRLFNGRVDLALAGYNAGEGAVMKYGYRVPPYRETQNYVQIIGTRYMKNRGLTPTAKTEPRPVKK